MQAAGGKISRLALSSRQRVPPGRSLTHMIPRTVPTWQADLAAAITDPLELLERLELSADTVGLSPAAARSFATRVPASYVVRMRKGDPGDPLLRQILPASDEMLPVAGYTRDPVGDLASMTRPGVLHKYAGRVLLIATGACAMHCRYCFRRHFAYGKARAARNGWQDALEYLAADTTVHEVILSGGDPLIFPDEKLHALTRSLADLPHLKRLRIHTRLPVALPSRVDEALLAWLTGTRLQTIVVLHANHPNELDVQVGEACSRLSTSRVTLLNQAVLLRGVNDDVDTQARLSERLFDLGVLPYYLHQLDRVQGAAHFAVDDQRALQILEALQGKLPGYLVPRLVRERAGAEYKELVGVRTGDWGLGTGD